MLIIKELKKRTSLLSTFATLFNALGNFKATESCYVHYLKTIKVNYGKSSLECSNCFFLMGSFYLTSSSPASPHLKKAISCFMACLKIRTGVLPESHTSISDCYYNIGIVLFLARNSNETTIEHLESIESSARNRNGIIDSGTLVERSLNWIWNALAIRVQNCGEENIHVAKIYEVLGLIFMELGDEKNAVEKLRMCLAIKWEVLGNGNHPEILSVVENLRVLLLKIEERKQEKNKKVRDILGVSKAQNNKKKASNFLNFLKKKEEEQAN